MKNIKLYSNSTALFVIDIQVDFCSPEGKAGKRGNGLKNIQSNINKLQDFANRLADKGMLVIFTRFLSGEGITPENLRKAIEKEGYDIPCEKGSGGEELYAVTPPSKAIVIDKPHYDAFAYTNLKNLLDQKKIKNVLITGVRTEVCVDATAKRAAAEGYNTFIIRDLVDTYDDKKGVHKQVLDFFKNYYGYVVTSDEILNSLS